MPRVVCPLCRTGFDANLTREDYAVNCVSCGVAFNAASFLTKDEFSTRSEKRIVPSCTPVTAEKNLFDGHARSSTSVVPAVAASSSGDKFSPPATPATRTSGLPFMNETGVPECVPVVSRQIHETSLPVLPVKEKELTASQERAAMLNGIIIEPSADECPVVLPAKISSDKAEAVVLGAVELRETKSVDAAMSQHAVAKVGAVVVPAVVKKENASPEVKVRKSRRPLLEGMFGPYDIEGEIARGGVGAVFRARERDTGREVALKVLLDGDEAGEAERERFRHECETAKALSLPGMVQVYTVGEIEQKPFMAMELVNGRSLDKVIPEKKLTVNDCLVLMKSVSETIGALHEAGYVHRDLKPANILIDAFGSPKVADFGLVKSLDEITRLTASGLVCGTPAYMAPEQARGDGKAVDPRSDVWALGAVLYEMLTCQPPFQAENALRLMLKITKDQPRPPRVLNLKVPADVQGIVLKCLDKNPEKRYANARAMSVDIAKFLNGEPLELSNQPNVQRIFKAASENRQALIMVGTGIAALVLVAVLVRVLFAPKDTTSLFETAQNELMEQKYELAERDLRQLVATDKSNARAWMLLGLCLGRTGIQNQQEVNPARVKEALSVTKHAADLDPKLSHECYAQVASFNRWKGNYASEASELECAVELSPNNLKYRERLGLAYWNAGRQTQSMGLFRKAESEFQAILHSDSEFPKVRQYIKQLREVLLPNGLTRSTPPVASHGR